MKRQLILGFSIVLIASLGGCGPTTEEKVQNLFQSAKGWIAKGEYDQAIKDYSEAIKLKPDDADAWNSRGHACRLKGEYDQAIKDYSEAIRLDPSLAIARINRRQAYRLKGEYSPAELASAAEATKLKPDDADAWFKRGIDALEEGDYDQAIKDLSQTIKLKPDYHRAWRFRGWAYKELGNEAKAKADRLKAAELKAKAKSKP